MNEGGAARGGALCTMVFLSLAVGMAVRPFAEGGTPPAQTAIPAALLNTALVCLALTPLLRLLQGGGFLALRGAGAGARPLLALAAALLALAGAAETVRAEAFLRYVSDEPLPRLLVYGVLVLGVLYALHCGLDSLLRVCGLAAGLFLCSMLLMLASNWRGMRLTNLTAGAFDAAGILRTAARGFCLPAELLLVFLLGTHHGPGEAVRLRRTLGLLCVFYSGLVFCTEAVLGPAAQMQQQTVHTLSRLGSLSVFRRLDAVHTGAWLLAELCRAAALACGACTALRRLLPPRLRAHAARYAAGLLLLALACCARLPEIYTRAGITAGTGALLLCAALPRGKRKENADAKRETAPV